MHLGIGANQIVPHHLPENRLPLAAIIAFADAECRKAVVTVLAHLVGFAAEEDVDQMPRAKPLTGAQRGRKGHADRFCSVKHLGGLVA